MSLDKWRGAWCGKNAYSAKSTAAPRHLHRASPLRYAAKPFLRRIYPSRDAALWFATPARQTCHAGMADVPRRRGRRAVPAWQIAKRHLRTARCLGETVLRRVETSVNDRETVIVCAASRLGRPRLVFPPHFLPPKAAKSGDAKYGTTGCGRRRRAPTGWHTHPRGTAARGHGGSPQPAKRPLVKECVEGSALL